MRLTTALRLAMVALAVASCRAGQEHGQLVKREPAVVYAAIKEAFSSGAMGGASQYSNLWNGGMQTLVEETSDTALDVVVKFDGQVANKVHFTFTPQDGAKATLIDADITIDQAVMRTAFTGTPQEQMASVPDDAYALGMQRLLKRYAERIEAGAPLNGPSEGWKTGEMELPPEFQERMGPDALAEAPRQEQLEKQGAAAAPMVDLDAATQRFPE